MPSKRCSLERVCFQMTHEIGARIRTRPQRLDGHTRLPHYLERKPGVVRAVLGEYPLPDRSASNPMHAPRTWLYTIEFQGRDVWPDGEGRIYADLFEEYLEAER